MTPLMPTRLNRRTPNLEEGVKGRLKPGFYADLVVLSKNIFEMDPLELRSTKIDATMVDGNSSLNAPVPDERTAI